MFAVASLLVVLLVSLLVNRVATVALTATGLSREAARFQARSALTGTGFTTTEAEAVVDHPVRRRIVFSLMLVGNAGIVAVLTSLIVGFARADAGEAGLRLAQLVGGLAILLVVSRSRWVDRRLTRLIARLLRRYTDLGVRDYVGLLDLAGDYSVLELAVEPRDWLAERRLDELALREEGVAVLGVYRGDGDYRGAPSGPTTVHAGDTMVVYGRKGELAELDRRRAGRSGDEAHEEAVARRVREVEAEERETATAVR